MPLKLEAARELLAACTRDARRAFIDRRKPPENPRQLAEVREWLTEAEQRLPLSQTEAVVVPLRRWVDEQERTRRTQFERQLGRGDEELDVFLDLLHAVRRPPEGLEKPTAAFQEVVSDLYDGFLSAQDRRGVVAPAKVTLPPLVRWCDPGDIYTWPPEAFEPLSVEGNVVCLARGYADGGLAGWVALGHETCGHDILTAYKDLLPELRRVVSRALEAASVSDRLIEHWMYSFEEAASDVMGVLNLGPAAALADVAFYRGCWPSGKPARLEMAEDPEDEHPVEALRVMLGASVVRGLRFGEAEDWARAIDREVRRDVGGMDLTIADRAVPFPEARASAAVFARALAGTRLESLSGVALGDIQNWRDHDQELARDLQAKLQAGGSSALRPKPRTYAAHVLAGALMASFEHAQRRSLQLLDRVIRRMVATLASMHGSNPAWQPKAVHRHRGDAVRHELTRRRERDHE